MPVTWNVAPTPGWLSAQIAPPIISANRLLITKPSPDPPYLRVVEGSPWLNDLNRFCICSGVIPIPVSRTWMWSITRDWSSDGPQLASPSRSSVPTSSLVTATTTSPCSVNFTALLSRLTRIWRRRVLSPISICGVGGAMVQARSSPFSSAFVIINSSDSSKQSRRLKTCCSSSIRPASILEKSKISLISVSNVSLLIRTVSTYSCCSASRLVSSNRLVSPIIAFIGVRISWLIFARNSVFIRLADSAASRAWCWASSAFCRSVMSIETSITPIISPCSS